MPDTKFILAKKIGSSHIFDKSGQFIPTTVLEAGPCLVTQIKSKDKDGYDSVQLSFGQKKRLNKPQEGHLKKIKSEKLEVKNFSKWLREFRISEEYIKEKSLKVGDKITVDNFKEGDKVSATGFAKGKGFQGVIRRHNFSRGPESHGSDHHREPGSIGSMFPQRVVKGTKLPGRMGVRRVTTKNLEVVKIDSSHNLLCIKGAVAGPKQGLILIKA